MTGAEIRQKYLRFFEERGHKVAPSSSLVPDDPTLLLTAAGMVQFKPIFEGLTRSNFSRATSCQKCVRTTDIENVGRTARHLTFFEMLGNFSFGDYYKKEAIPWAWEFVTEHLGLDASKLSVTVFQDDEEAFDIWTKDVGLAAASVYRLGADDNFWSAGPVGACGPCTELIYGPGERYGGGSRECGVACDCDRVLELWILVFLQFSRDESGELHRLERTGVDTGMGLERTASVLQGVDNNFETDLIRPVLACAEAIGGVKFRASDKSDLSIKIMADHGRAVTFMVADGVLPSNEGRGYVLRRLLRRAVRHGRLLGADRPFMGELAASVTQAMGESYPELVHNRDFVLRIVESEEERFMRTLRQGLSIMEEMAAQAKSRDLRQLDGEAVFRLYDTYGFPIELTREIASESGLAIDEELVRSLMEEQRERARASWTGERLGQGKEVYIDVLEQYGPTRFTGYDSGQGDANIAALIQGEVVVPELSEGAEGELVLDRTPFYAEKGGQVGDVGVIKGPNGTFEVTACVSPVEGLTVHGGVVAKGVIHAGDACEPAIDARRRADIRRNHTATHLVHWALRHVLGDHVKQAGSLVGPDRARFDFTHFTALTPEEQGKVELLVNERVMENHPVVVREMSLEEARASRAVALFGEKYGDTVRVVESGEFSRELCGGTHVSATGQVGLMKIVSEGSVGANTRRIEFVTGRCALESVSRDEGILHGVSALLKTTPDKAVERLQALLEELEEKKRLDQSAGSRKADEQVAELASRAERMGESSVVVAAIAQGGMDELRTLADKLRERLGSSVVVLVATSESKALVLCAATDDLVPAPINAGGIVCHLAPIVGGRGGGRPDIAQAGGSAPERVDELLAEAGRTLREALGSG